MQTHFFVAHDGEQIGPFSVDEILQKIESKEIDVNDYVYDEETQDWVVLMAYPAVSEKLQARKPAAPPKAKVTSISDDKSADAKSAEWFVLKGESKFGPFSYFDLVKMLQDKTVFEFDYVWNKGLETWARVAELPDFDPAAIRKLKSGDMPQLTEIFFRRRHARVDHGGSILVHDNRTVWKGKAVEISSGGAGIIVENALLQPNQTVYLHFKPGDGMPPFNAVCEIVSKKFTQVNDKSSPVQYGVRFTQINPQTRKEIKAFADRKQQAA